METKKYEVIIIGSGPAGLTAALYTGRANLSTLVLDKMYPGGQLMLTDAIENYPGFPESISGPELTEKMKAQAEKWGAEIVISEVKTIERVNDLWTVKTNTKSFSAYSVILATGASPRTLGLENEKRFTGRGVSYCATCDGQFFRGREVVVVGGGDSACQEANYLAKICSKVTIIHRRDKLRASPALQQRVFKRDNIAFEWEAVVVDVLGEEMVSGVKVKNVKTEAEKEIACEGVFIFIGYIPSGEFLKGIVDLDEEGYVITNNKDLATNQEGIFACGEIRQGATRQIVSVCGEGATAALAAQHYVEALQGRAYE